MQGTTGSEMPIHILDALDLSWIEDTLIKERKYNSEKAKKAVHVYRCILKIAFLHPDRAVTPPGSVDDVLHTHILDTKRYLDDCMKVFGEFVHHNPSVANSPEFWESWEFTVEKLNEYFGISLSLDGFSDDFWPRGCILVARGRCSDGGVRGMI